MIIDEELVKLAEINQKIGAAGLFVKIQVILRELLINTESSSPLFDGVLHACKKIYAGLNTDTVDAAKVAQEQNILGAGNE